MKIRDGPNSICLSIFCKGLPFSSGRDGHLAFSINNLLAHKNRDILFHVKHMSLFCIIVYDLHDDNSISFACRNLIYWTFAGLSMHNRIGYIKTGLPKKKHNPS